MMEPYQERVIEEKKALDEKRKALKTFLARQGEARQLAQVTVTPTAVTVAPEVKPIESEELSRMQRQLAVMTQYSNILAERIGNFV